MTKGRNIARKKDKISINTGSSLGKNDTTENDVPDQPNAEEEKKKKLAQLAKEAMPDFVTGKIEGKQNYTIPEIKHRDDYRREKTKTTHIISEHIGMINQIAGATGVPSSHLISNIIESWIDRNRDELQEIMLEKINPFRK